MGKYIIEYRTDNGREKFNEKETLEGTHEDLANLIRDIRANGGFNIVFTTIPEPDKEKVKMVYTWDSLLTTAIKRGSKFERAQDAIGRMMDQVEEDTGTWPNWSDIAPQWAAEAVYGR